ncbi:MAG TPA: hypothetical protein VK177_15115, partial [Flavobacteriales bacterium]|nr:hypothetical protein [Flavobacteriales bacterium]
MAERELLQRPAVDYAPEEEVVSGGALDKEGTSVTPATGDALNNPNTGDDDAKNTLKNKSANNNDGANAASSDDQGKNNVLKQLEDFGILPEDLSVLSGKKKNDLENFMALLSLFKSGVKPNWSGNVFDLESMIRSQNVAYKLGSGDPSKLWRISFYVTPEDSGRIIIQYTCHAPGDKNFKYGRFFRYKSWYKGDGKESEEKDKIKPTIADTPKTTESEKPATIQGTETNTASGGNANKDTTVTKKTEQEKKVLNESKVSANKESQKKTTENKKPAADKTTGDKKANNITPVKDTAKNTGKQPTKNTTAQGAKNTTANKGTKPSSGAQGAKGGTVNSGSKPGGGTNSAQTSNKKTTKPLSPENQKYVGKRVNETAFVKARTSERKKFKGVILHPKPIGSSKPENGKIYKGGTSMKILAYGNDENKGWIYVKMPDGQEGWISSDWITNAKEGDDKKYTLHYVEEGETATNLLQSIKGVQRDIGYDNKTFANAMYLLNKDNPDLVLDPALYKKSLDDNSYKNVVDPWDAEKRAIYQSMRIKQGGVIKIPTKETIDKMMTSGQIRTRPEWFNKGVKFGRIVEGLFVGIPIGIG